MVFLGFMKVPLVPMGFMPSWTKIIILKGTKDGTSRPSPKKKPILGSGRRKIITPLFFMKLKKAMRDLQKRA